MTNNQLSISNIRAESHLHDDDDKTSSHAQSSNQIPSILLPLQEQILLLPRTAIAEIIPYIEPKPLPNAPYWLCGTVHWREQILLLVSFEALQRKPIPPLSNHAHIVILNTVRRHSSRKFYALIIQNIPQLILAHGNNLSAFPHAPSSPFLHCRAEINQLPALIPNLEYLEETLQRCVTG
ncbi:CheW protein [Nitrosococcus watsonii C-113]|uniref:CheW protein n=2 Tax=Nitrosococcus TaxID=1227 RepID=D8K896_NITWC|nr:CheW protein [Nitrosococcus watsonii C-113]